MRTIELGVTITDAAINDESTTIFCTPVARDPRCPDCGREGRYRDTGTPDHLTVSPPARCFATCSPTFTCTSSTRWISTGFVEIRPTNAAAEMSLADALEQALPAPCDGR